MNYWTQHQVYRTFTYAPQRRCSDSYWSFGPVMNNLLQDQTNFYWTFPHVWHTLGRTDVCPKVDHINLTQFLKGIFNQFEMNDFNLWLKYFYFVRFVAYGRAYKQMTMICKMCCEDRLFDLLCTKFENNYKSYFCWNIVLITSLRLVLQENIFNEYKIYLPLATTLLLQFKKKIKNIYCHLYL